MKLIQALYFLTILLLCTNIQASNGPNGAGLYSQNCMSCHGGGQTMGERIAPPIVAVKNHYIKIHTEKEDFINAIVQWVQQPSKEHTLMPGAVNKFGLMPALPISPTRVLRSLDSLLDSSSFSIWFSAVLHRLRILL